MARPVAAGVIAALVLLGLIDGLGARAGLVAGAVPHSDGPWLWIASRAAGVSAFLALALAVAFGLFLSTGAADRWLPRRQSAELHRWLSAATLALIGVHALLLLGDGFVRFDLIAVLVPFASPYRPVAVGIGVLAGLSAVIIHGSFALRRRIGARTWRRLHYLSFVALALALAHGLLAGSDAGAAWMRAVYLVTAAVVTALLAARVAAAAGRAARPDHRRRG